MRQGETEIGGPTGGWASTLWSTVLEARDRQSDAGRKALERLAGRYWKPVYFFIRARRRDVDAAKDLTQGFFAYLLEKELIRRASPEQGSFRAYLRAILERFLSDQRDRDGALKRGGGAVQVSLDFVDAETDFAHGPRAPETPEEAFERSWAEESFARVLERFQTDCRDRGRPQWFEVFRLRFGLAGGEYSEIARKLGITESDVTNYLHRARERFRELLVEELGQGVSTQAALADEIRAIGKYLERPTGETPNTSPEG